MTPTVLLAMYNRLIIRLLLAPYFGFIACFCSIADANALTTSELLHVSKLNKRALVVLQENEDRGDQARSLLNLLDGMGVPFDTVDLSSLDKLTISKYQLIIVAPQKPVQPAQGSRFLHLLRALREIGINVLLVGPYFCGLSSESFSELFGVELNETKCISLPERNNRAFVYLQGARPFAVQDEKYLNIRVGKAVGLGFLSNGKPILTVYQPTFGKGKMVLAGISLLDRWKDYRQSTREFYKRPLLISLLIRSLMSEGYVGKHSTANGHMSLFMLRWEDVVPVDIPRFHELEYGRVSRLLRLGMSYGVPINIAIIARYVSPTRSINDGWSLQNSANNFFRESIKTLLANGGSLIVHGHTHQYGDSIDDMSALDHEMSDDSGRRFRPYEEQYNIVKQGFSSAIKDWGVMPRIWETPHYAGNDDTYRAALNIGFRFVNEWDQQLFPGRLFLGSGDELDLLNIPESAGHLPDTTLEIRQNARHQLSDVLPDLNDIGAPYLLFFHIGSDERIDALSRILSAASTYDLWKPSIEEYADFWSKRESVRLQYLVDIVKSNITVRVDGGFPGLTLVARLPDQFKPGVALLNGRPIDFRMRQYRGSWYAYPVLEESGTSYLTIDMLPSRHGFQGDALSR